MFTKEEVKEFVAKHWEKVIFPNVSNRISKYVVFAGVGIVVGINPWSIVILNWLVDLVNKSNSLTPPIPHLSTDRTDYIWGVVLIFVAMLHNLLYQWIKFSHDKIEKEQQHIMKMAEFQRIESLELKDKEMENINNQLKMETDKSLFERFLRDFPSDSSSAILLKQHNFWDAYHMNNTDQIDTFVDEWNTAETKFLNEEIETIRITLWNECRILVDLLGRYSFSVMGGPMTRVYPEIYYDVWETPAWLDDRVDGLNLASRKCYDLHQSFISLCRNKLKC